jgi:hypothetical protein
MSNGHYSILLYSFDTLHAAIYTGRLLHLQGVKGPARINFVAPRIHVSESLKGLTSPRLSNYESSRILIWLAFSSAIVRVTGLLFRENVKRTTPPRVSIGDTDRF